MLIFYIMINVCALQIIQTINLVNKIFVYSDTLGLKDSFFFSCLEIGAFPKRDI